MLRPRFAFLLGAVAAVGLAGAGCAEQSAAIRVGDDTVSEKDFLDEVQTLGESEPALQFLLGVTRTDVAGELGEDSYSQEFIGVMVQQRVSSILQEQLAEQEGIEVTDADLDEVRGQLQTELQNSGMEMDDLPDAFLDQFVEDVAIGQALQAQVQQDGNSDLQTAFLELIDNADVEVSSRFGEWDKDAFVAGLQGDGEQLAAVTPPPGPRAAPGDESSAEGVGGTDPGSPAG